MIKVVRIVPFLNFGGVEQRILSTVKGFRNHQNCKLIVLVCGSGGKVSEELENLQLPAVILNDVVKIPNLGLIWRLYREIKNINPDVVHTSSSEANFHGLIAAWLAGVKVKIGEEVGFPNHNFIWKYLFKFIYSLSDKFIGISEAVVENTVYLNEVPKSKTIVVYNPVQVDVDLSFRKNDLHRPFTFITVCRLVPVKNLKRLIQGFASFLKIVENLGPKLIIVGDGPEKDVLLNVVKDWNLTKQVEFLGYQSDVSHFLINSDVFVLPSLSEGFSIALVEAMLHELPCIATKVGGPSEILNPDIGILVDPYSISSIESALVNLYKLTKEKRLAMGKLAREDALLRFSTEKHIHKLFALYKEVYESKSSLLY